MHLAFSTLFNRNETTALSRMAIACTIEAEKKNGVATRGIVNLIKFSLSASWVIARILKISNI